MVQVTRSNMDLLKGMADMFDFGEYGAKRCRVVRLQVSVG